MPSALRPDCSLLLSPPLLLFRCGCAVWLILMTTTPRTTLAAFVAVETPPAIIRRSHWSSSALPPAARRWFAERRSEADNTSGGGGGVPSKKIFDDQQQRNGFSPLDYDPSRPMLSDTTTGKNTRSSPPSKADVYSDDDLLNLLNIHNNLTQSVPGFGTTGTAETAARSSSTKTEEDELIQEEGEPSSAVGSILSLQDLVERTVQEISNGEEEESAPAASATNDAVVDDDNTDQSENRSSLLLRFESHFTFDDFRTVLPQIRGIATDVDGTLLSHDHTLHPLTQKAVERAVEAVWSPLHPLRHFFLATGKTRAGALRSLGPRVAALLQNSAATTPAGVYIQGVYVVGADGRVLFEQKLSRGAVEHAHDLTLRHDDMSLIAYDGDALYASASSNVQHIQDVATKYGEPKPTPLDDIVKYEPGFHKLLLMSDDTDYLTATVRPELEALAAQLGDCVVTQAIPTMLELLPAGCSKAAGVQILCESLQLDVSTQVCAVGDAENDLGMLREAAVGVAVGNAATAVKEAADVVVRDTHSQGGAGRAIELFGLGEVLELLPVEKE